MDDFLSEIEKCGHAVKSALDAIEDWKERASNNGFEKFARLLWIERQLTNIKGRISAIESDIEAGVGLQEMGFSDSQEMHDLLSEMKIEVIQLLEMGRAQSLGVERSS